MFERVADGVANEPFSLGRGVIQPLFAESENEGRVILGDVAEVIGNAAAHVEIGIIFERFENRKDRSGIDDEGGNTLRPRQSRTGSFRAQAADMRIGVTGPILQPGQGASGGANDERADGKLGGKAAGEGILELHRRFEGIAPAVVRGIMTVKGSEAPMRQVKEDAESEILSFAVGRRERALQHGARGREVGRQMGVQHAREVLTALHESKGRQAGGGGATKRRGVKFRPGECEIVREAVDRVAIEERGERAAFLNRARCHRQAERAGQGGARVGGEEGQTGG